MSSGFFEDIMSDPNINWGTNPIKIHHIIKKNVKGTLRVIEDYEEPIEVSTSPQALSADEIESSGYGNWASGEVYSCLILQDVPLNTDNTHYRTVLFNGREYELINSVPFVVNKGTSMEDGYYEITFARRIKNLGAEK